MNNLPIPFPSTFDDVDSLSNWMNDYQEFYNSHVEDETTRRNFTFTLVKFINEITFALEKEGMGPRSEAAVTNALAYLRSRDKDTGKPLMRIFEVEWPARASVQVKAESAEQAEIRAVLLSEEDPLEIQHSYDLNYVETSEVPE